GGGGGVWGGGWGRGGGAAWGARFVLPAAAGLGFADDAARLLPSANADARHRALSLAAQHGHPEIVRLLLNAGEDPNRYNPEGNHPHSTPLHQAVLGGHEAVVRLLVERGARLDLRDTVWHGTPLGWARHGGRKKQAEMVACLRSLGAVELPSNTSPERQICDGYAWRRFLFFSRYRLSQLVQ